MYRVQNLSNRDIVFQGVTIPPYGIADYAIITDFIALSRFCNANKIRYSTFTPAKEEAPAVVEAAKPVADEKAEVVEPVVEPIEESAEKPVIEEAPTKVSDVEEAPKKKNRGSKTRLTESDEK